ncbi:MAG: peptidylprolyl isomerase [Bacteroidetes bacterium]|nr:peptidylprolyl isomerase [Bacteroidota bacterium]MBS1739543.1 peptidylprolyl isomerase [Bacteroidota bacterium]
MAVIQKIRDKYAKLAGFIIALALVGFILMDAASGRFGDLFGRDTSIAKVNGDKIDYKDYTERVQEYESLYSLMNNNKSIDDNTRAQIHDQVLREMIFENLIGNDAEKLGISVTKEEEKEMISGPNPDPLVMQFPYFKNQETGQFDPNYLMQFEKNQLDLSRPEAQKAMEQWQELKHYVIRSRVSQKYMNLFAGMAFTPKFITDRTIKDQNTLGSISYVKVPFTSVNDNEVKVSDADLKAYIEKHKAQYTIDEPNRSMDYVSFDVHPSSADTATVLNNLNQLKNEFTTTNDAESFVNKNSDDQFRDMFLTKKTYPSQFADSLFNLPVGAVYGPYFENGSYKMARVLEKRSLPDSVSAQHILIAINQTRDDSAAKKTADSILAAIKSGANFDSLAVKFSDDPGSKTKGGDLGFFPYGAMVHEFNDAAFLGNTGDLKEVKTQFGYHIIKVKEQRNFSPAAKIAIITKELEPSQETDQTSFAKANEFAGKNTTGKAFDEAVKKQGLNKLQAQNIKLNDFVMQGLGSARDIIRWMYEAKVGDVSPVFNLDGRYVIARLTNIQEKGLLQIDDNNKPMFENMVKAEKKAEIIKSKYKSATSLASIAQGSAQQIQNVDSFNAASAYLPNLGYEPKVVGYTFYDGFKPNTMSPGIQGQDGVFYISLKEKFTRQATQDPMMQQQMAMQNSQLKNAIMSSLQESMKRNANIKYSAKNLY